MRVPLKWLGEFVDISGIQPDELSQRLLLAGIEVEKIEIEGEFSSDYKIVEVIEVKRKEGIRLPICVIFDGQSKYEVVSGAENVKKGKFLWCPPGGKIKKDGGIIEISTKKVQDVSSYGMLLSPREIGFSYGEETKLLEVPPDTKVGRRANEVLGLPELVLDISPTPQRGDLLSIFGVAIEISAIFGRELSAPYLLNLFYSLDKVEEYFLNLCNTSEEIEIEILNKEKNPLYIGSIFSGKIEKTISHPLIISRLYLCGARPINPIVDATNYCLFEFGQPTHAFDLKKVKGRKIYIKDAEKGEKILCLDGKERELDQDDLVIADTAGSIAIAGVIGGEKTGVDIHTTEILLESAFFVPSTVRKTAKKLGIETESSYRFARRVNPAFVFLVIPKIIEILKAEGFTFKGTKVLKYPHKSLQNPEVSIHKDFVSDIAGIHYSEKEVEENLAKLKIKVIKNKEKIVCVPPLWRGDIQIKEDIAEEVIRISGYDKITCTIPKIPAVYYESTDEVQRRNLIERVRDFISSLGFNEVKTYPFSSHGKIKIKNPIISDFAYLCEDLAMNIYTVIESALKKGWKDIRVFEIAKNFSSAEKDVIAFGICGSVYPPVWNLPKKNSDIFSIKAIVEYLIPEARFQPKKSWMNYSFSILKRETECGTLGYILDRKFKTEIYIAEIDIDSIEKNIFFDIPQMKFISELPFVERDISFFLREGVSWQNDIKPNFLEPEIVDAFPIDIWEDKTQGRKSMTVRLIIKQNKVLTSDEIDEITDKIIAKLEKLNLQVRKA